MERVDVAIVGGGIVGLATAHAILRARPGLRVVVFEKEERPGTHQSGRNSGVIHSGVYYHPGSLKARTVAAGRKALLHFCVAEGIRHQMIGKVIVAVDESECPRLLRLEERARQSGVAAELIGASRLRELEPHAAGIAALHIPGAAIVDFGEVCQALTRLVREAGGDLRTRSKVLELAEDEGSVIVRMKGDDVEAGTAVNCAGLHSDLLARKSSVPGSPMLRIVPFRGEYRMLAENRKELVRTMIYPVPDPQFPFLGVHFTRSVLGEVHAGPNAVLALAREGYSWQVVDVADLLDLLRFPGFWRLADRHWRTGIQEVWRSLSRAAFLKALQRLVPEVAACDLSPAPSGVRAQAVDHGGALVDDFVLRKSNRVVHVLNAPSPAATASLEIGQLVAARILGRI